MAKKKYEIINITSFGQLKTIPQLKLMLGAAVLLELKSLKEAGEKEVALIDDVYRKKYIVDLTRI